MGTREADFPYQTPGEPALEPSPGAAACWPRTRPRLDGRRASRPRAYDVILLGTRSTWRRRKRVAARPRLTQIPSQLHRQVGSCCAADVAAASRGGRASCRLLVSLSLGCWAFFLHDCGCSWLVRGFPGERECRDLDAVADKYGQPSDCLMSR